MYTLPAFPADICPIVSAAAPLDTYQQ